MMNEEQRYQFDTRGYIVVPNAVSLDQVERMKSNIRRPTEQWDGSVDKMDGPLHWDCIWRDLLDLPALTPILEELVGEPGLMAGRLANADKAEPLPTFRLDHINSHTHISKGFAGGMLHGGPGVNGQFRYHDGRFYNGLLTVSLELFDTFVNGGGFGCIPGTHKSNVPMPKSWHDLSREINPMVTRIPAVPGNAIIFTEALMHGTLPWAVDAPRATVFYKFSPHSMSWGADFFEPADYHQYNDMDDRKLAILEPPNARYRGRPSQPARLQREN